LFRLVYRLAKDSAFGPGSMFIFAGGLCMVAVGVACALPKELANSPREEDEDNEIKNYEQLILDCEASQGSSKSYGSITY
jgi:hypothetical protein